MSGQAAPPRALSNEEALAAIGETVAPPTVSTITMPEKFKGGKPAGVLSNDEALAAIGEPTQAEATLRAGSTSGPADFGTRYPDVPGQLPNVRRNLSMPLDPVGPAEMIDPAERQRREILSRGVGRPRNEPIGDALGRVVDAAGEGWQQGNEALGRIGGAIKARNPFDLSPGGGGTLPDAPIDPVFPLLRPGAAGPVSKDVGTVLAAPFAGMGPMVNETLGDPLHETPSPSDSVWTTASRALRGTARLPLDLPVEGSKLVANAPGIGNVLDATMGPQGREGVASILPFAAPFLPHALGAAEGGIARGANAGLDALARTGVGERVLPGRAAAQVPLEAPAMPPAYPPLPRTQLVGPMPGISPTLEMQGNPAPSPNFIRVPPEPPAAPTPVPAGPGVILPGSAPPTVPVNPRNPLAVGLRFSEGYDQALGIPAPPEVPVTLGEVAGAKIPPLAKRAAERPPAPIVPIDKVIDATQPPPPPKVEPKPPEVLPDAIKATELAAEEQRGKAAAIDADRRRAELAALPHDQLLEIAMGGEPPAKPAPAAPAPPVVEPPAGPTRYGAAQTRRMELQNEGAQGRQAELLRGEAMDRRNLVANAEDSSNKRQTLAVADGMDRVAKGESVADVAAAIEASLPKMTDAEVTEGFWARSQFESAVKVLLGEKNLESRGPASGPAANAGLEKNGPESAQPSAEQAPAGEGAAAGNGAAPAPVPPEPAPPAAVAPKPEPAPAEIVPAKPAEVAPEADSTIGQYRIRAKPGEVFDPETMFNQVDTRSSGSEAEARVVPLPGGKFAAEFREGFEVASEPWNRVATTDSFDEGLQAIAKHTETPTPDREGATIDTTAIPQPKRFGVTEPAKPVGADEAPASPADTSGTSTVPAAPEPVRYGAKRPTASGEPGSEGTWPVADMHVDAKAMQFKEAIDEATGETGTLKDVKTPEDWKRSSEGVVTLWRDPKTGNAIVADGHQRVGAAKRAGVKELLSRFSEAKTLAEARIEGALINARAGSLTAHDAARLFREIGKSGDELRVFLRQERIPNNAAVRQGRALANLSADVWDRYRRGEIDDAKAVAIGDSEATPEIQRKLAKSSATPAEIAALSRRMGEAATTKKTVAGDMFSTDTTVDTSLYEVEAKLETELLKALSKEKRALRSAIENKATIERVGSVDAAAAEKIAQETGTLADVAREELKFRGPLRDAITATAREVSEGKLTPADAVRRLRDESAGIIAKAHPELAVSLNIGEEVTPPAPSEPTLFGERPAEKVPEKPKDGGTTLFSGIPPMEAVKAVTKGIKVGEGAYSTVTKGWLGDTRDAAMKLPGAPRVATFLKDWFSPERDAAVSPKYGAARRLGAGKGDVARAEGNYFGEHLGEELKDVPADVQDALYEYLGSEADAPPAGLSGKALDLAQRGSELVNEGRRALVSMGRRSVDALNEYPRFLVRFMQNVELAERARNSPGSGTMGTKLPEQFSRQDAHEMRVRLPRADVEAHLKDADLGVDPQFVGEFQGRALVKFPDTPEGAAAREAFVDHVKSAHADARRDLNRLSTNEFTGKTPGTKAAPNRNPANPNVQQGKMLHKASLETPRAADLGITTADPLSPEMRELMGEDRNPATALARTIANVRSEVAKAEMFQAIRDGSDAKGAWAMEPTRDAMGKTEAPPKGFTHVSSTRLGAIHDSWLRQDVWDDLKGVYGKDMGKTSILRHIYEVSRGLTDELKTNLTIRNPANQVQNWISMPTESIEAGFSVFNPENWPHMKEAIRQMHDPDPFDPMQREIIEQGIDSGAQMAEHEIGPSRDAWSNPSTSTSYKVGRSLINPAQWLPEKIGGGKVGRGIAAADSRLGAEYNRSASIIRRGKYMKLREEGLSPEAARADVNKFTTNYEQQGRFINEMRKLPVSPFITYPYERMRVLANNFIEHPTRAMWTLFGGYALKQMLQATFGGKVSEEEKKGAAAEYGKSRLDEFGNQYAATIGRNDDGSPRVWDTGALFTLDRMMRGPEDQIDESALMSALKYAGKNLGMEAGPVFQQGIVQITGRDYFSGKEMLTLGDRAGSIGKTFAHPDLPYVGSKAEKIRHSFNGEPYAKTKPAISLGDALFDALAHIRIDGYVPEKSQQNLLWALGRGETHANKLFNADLEDANAAGDEPAAQKVADEYATGLDRLYTRFGAQSDVHDKAQGKTPKVPAGGK